MNTLLTSPFLVLWLLVYVTRSSLRNGPVVCYRWASTTPGAVWGYTRRYGYHGNHHTTLHKTLLTNFPEAEELTKTLYFDRIRRLSDFTGENPLYVDHS